MHSEDQTFVGRAEELERLRLRLATVSGDNLAKTMLVSGDAGVGKSRLLREFTRIARDSGAYLLHGSCDEHLGGLMPYLPLMEALEGFDRDHGTAKAKELGGPSYSLLTDLFNGTGQPAADGLGAPHQVFLALRRMLDQIGAERPVVLVVEDLHWADLSTLGLVSALARARPEGRRTMLVCSHRPSDLVRDTPLWGMLANADFVRRVEHMTLPAFTEQELRQFLGDIGGAPVPDAVLRRCMEWSDGIAFQAEQLMAAGVLDEDDVRLPPILDDVMMSQVSGASEEARKVLRVAAVAGRRMSHRLLRKVSGLAGDTLNDALQVCLDRRMLVPDQADGVYRFRHALLRETMYQRTATGTKAELHVAMAEAIVADPRLSVGEAVTADAEEAYHWHRAGRLPEALRAAVRAGRAAERTLAFSSAELQFDRVLELWNAVEDAEKQAGLPLVEVLAAAADAARWSGHLKEAVGHVEAAIALVDPVTDPDLAGELHERLGNHLWEDGQRKRSDEAYARAAALLTDRPASAGKARVVAARALAELRAGRHRDGRRMAQKALVMARDVDARAEEGRALNVSGVALGMLDDVAGAERHLREALAIAREVHNLEDLFRAYSNLCLVLEHGGRLMDAAELAKEGLAEAQQLDVQDTRQGSVLANNASVVLVLLGYWDEAEAIITQSMLSRQVGESLYPRLTLAEVQVARGRFAQAKQMIASLSIVEQVTDVRFLGPFHAVQAELALWEGRHADAVEQVRLGIAAVQGGENVLEMLRLCAIGLRCAADRGDSGSSLSDRLAQLAAVAVKDASRTAEIEQLVLLGKAERQRLLGGRNMTMMWAGVAQGWANLDRRYPAAYARWREAEAAVAEQHPDQAKDAARAAYATAHALRAEPLQRQVEALAAAAQLDLAVRREPVGWPYELTRTEFEIFGLLYEGLKNTEIAKRRSISTRTVETHLRRIYTKLGVHSRSDAIVKALREGTFGR
ncbi:AAA family ATPase [Dactylosporangium sp. NPDC049525]|uniref:ATP-binding protein n=1 Tax=Dactylosporangium sp. NPDC049525 TaxID=3154730 RepID=UPI0034338E37